MSREERRVVPAGKHGQGFRFQKLPNLGGGHGPLIQTHAVERAMVLPEAMKMAREVERRAVAAPVEIREAAGKKTLVGYAALYDSASEDLGGFVEVLRAGCFDRAMKEGQDVLARMEHDTRLLLGRSSNGTLRLSTDAKGLKYEVDIPDTQAGRDTAALVARGDVRGSSFAFRVPDPQKGQRWSNKEGQPLRELLDLDLVDVAPTALPAYPETTVSARAIEMAAELRGATPFGDLPLAPRERAWDVSSAYKRVQKWASSDESGTAATIDWAKLRKAFFWYDAENAEAFGGYKLQFADIVDGKLTAIPRAIFACAGVMRGARGGVDIPMADRAEIKARISRYYQKMREQFNDQSVIPPWERSALTDDEERAFHRVLDRMTVEQRESSYEDKIQALYAALLDVLGGPWSSEDNWWCIEASFDDRVIVERFEGITTYYQYPVSYGADGVPVLGEPVEVEEQYVPVAPDAGQRGAKQDYEGQSEIERLRRELEG